MQGKDMRAEAGELRRKEDYEQAFSQVTAAGANFERLRNLEGAVAALSTAKLRGKDRLQMHIAFCDSLRKKVVIMVGQVRPEPEALH